MAQNFNVYSIYDEKALSFGSPILSQTDGTMSRTIIGWKDNESFLPNRAPEDYKLYCIGTFDDSQGLVVSLDVPRLVCSIQSLLS